MSHQWMPPAWSVPIVKTPTLGKGKACICCRRRKMRCDGTHPVCNQCVANGRELDCEYSDGVNPTRTEMLEERLAELQERLAELEGRSSGNESSGSIHGGDSRSGSSQSSLRKAHVARAAARLLGRSSGSGGSSARWWNNEMPPAQIAQTLIETFFQHSEQLGFSLNITRLITALATPFNSPTYPHKALLNATFLWGVRVTASHADSNAGGADPRQSRDQETALLERATKHMQSQLANENPRRGLQSVQAEVLLATYLFSKGRALEGSYHLNAAVSLATTFGIHRVRVRSGHGTASSSSRQMSAHGTADSVEEGERICTFWRVFELDRLWAIASNSTAILQERDSNVKIDTPWPLTMAEYEAGESHDGSTGHTSTVKEFLDNRGRVAKGTSPLALSAKAALLSERATRLACIRTSTGNDHNLFAEIRQLDETIVYFISRLSPIPGNANLADKACLIGIHVQAYASLIHLHDSVSQNDATAYSSCLNAAKLIAATVGHLHEDEVNYVSPFVTTGLIVACKVLIRDLAVNQQRRQSSPHEDLVAEVQMIIRVLKQLKSVYPVVEAQLNSIQATLGSLNIAL